MHKNVLPPTAKRIQIKTNPCVNNEIRNCTINCINTHKNGTPEMLNEKINELNSEWDTERIVETSAAAIVLMCSFLGIRRSKWFIMTGMIGCFLMQHALLGWCPTLPIIRGMGVRTADEISNEKTAFKMARGDFNQTTENASEMLTIAEK